MGTVRNSPFMRQSSTSPGLQSNSRPKSALFGSPLSPLSTSSPPTSSHVRGKSSGTGLAGLGLSSGSDFKPGHVRAISKGDTPHSNTFAPSFIKTDEVRRGSDTVDGIEGENDFSGKRYVWLKDPQTAFVKGWIVEDLGGNRILVQCDDGSVGFTKTLKLVEGWAVLIWRFSNEKSTPRAPTRSILRNSTRRTTWPN